MKRFLLCISYLLAPLAAVAGPLPYAVATAPTPVYNNLQAAASIAAPPTDSCGQVRQLEFIAFTGTPFQIVAETVLNQQPLLEVTTPSYQPQPGVRLFVAANNLKRHAVQPALPTPSIPSAEEIVRRLRSAVGLPYVWGGNLRQGLRLGQAQVYAGLDCSGLLYESTDGSTPRNTADLIDYGQAVPVTGLTTEQLMKRLKPLDLIVWKGHVVIVADKGQAIESVLLCGQAGNGGVRLTPLHQRLREIMASRHGADRWPSDSHNARSFVVRRWLP